MKDALIYRLYSDNTEAQVCNTDDLINHDGLFGIEIQDWTSYRKKIS